jgi:predicted nucleic acid-binding protein
VKEPVVCDSTCLIGLERIGKLNIITALFEPICVPPAVDAEFNRKFDWLLHENIVNRSIVTVLEMVVDLGEAEAIALAKEKDFLLVTDDKQARAAAKRFGLKVIGTVGVLLRAKNAGAITEVKPIIDQLDAVGFRIGRLVRDEALRIAGELDD